MKSNRLVPWQFSPGLTVDATRIEASLRELARLFDDVPADLVQRRWSPSPLVWGLLPAQFANPVDDTSTAGRLPWMRENSKDSNASLQLIPAGDFSNPFRVKSNVVGTGTAGHELETRADLLTWEVSILATHPMIIGDLTVMADASGAPYDNDWIVTATNAPTTDYTLQVGLSDAWDLENRKKLRQASLVYQTPSDGFAFSAAAAGADTVIPAYSTGEFQGFGVWCCPLVLVPAGARVFFQWTIPWYDAPVPTSWGETPWRRNAWSLSTRIWSPTR